MLKRVTRLGRWYLNQSSHIAHCSYCMGSAKWHFWCLYTAWRTEGAFLLLNQKSCVPSAFMDSKKSRMKREIFVHAARNSCRKLKPAQDRRNQNIFTGVSWWASTLLLSGRQALEPTPPAWAKCIINGMSTVGCSIPHPTQRYPIRYPSTYSLWC